MSYGRGDHRNIARHSHIENGVIIQLVACREGNCMSMMRNIVLATKRKYTLTYLGAGHV